MKKKVVISTSTLVIVVAVGYGSVAVAMYGEQKGQDVMHVEMRMENAKTRAAIRHENMQERKDLRQRQHYDVKEMRDRQRQERKELRQDFRNATSQEREALREKGKMMRRENMQERHDMREENRKERMNGRIGAVRRRAGYFSAQYGRVTTKLTNIAARLTEAGINTAGMRTAISTLDKKAINLTKAYDAYENALDSGDKNTIATARQTLVAARKDFRIYYRETVRPAIKNAILTARAQSNDA